MKLPAGVRAHATGNRIDLVLGGEVLAHLPVVQANEKHRNFILSTWVRSYQNVARKVMDKETYAREESLVAERFWGRSSVAVSPEDEYVIHGWVCNLGSHVYHAYVPPDFRRHGMASEILRVTASDAKKLQIARPTEWKPKGFRCEFNPYILRSL